MMGRSIPSFRQLIDIERLNWSEFKKELPSKRDKQAFDLVFENAILYSSYLSSASNHIPLDSILMGTLFHNYKILTELMRKARGNPIENELDGSITFQDVNRLLYEDICKKWKGMIYSIHRGDEKLMLDMLSAVCQNYEKVSILNPEDSKFNQAIMVHLALILNNQKLIDKINKESKKSGRKNDQKKLTGID